MTGLCRADKGSSAVSVTVSGRTRRVPFVSRPSLACANVSLALSGSCRTSTAADGSFHRSGNETTGKVESVGIKDVQAGDGHVAVVLVSRFCSRKFRGIGALTGGHPHNALLAGQRGQEPGWHDVRP